MKKLLTLIITALLLIPTASTAQTTKNRQSKGAQSKISTSTLRGDVNGDGDTNITDVALTVNHILGNSSGTFNEAAADLNGDREVNITDVVTLVDIILNGDDVPDLELSSTTVVVTEGSATVEIISGSGNYELSVSDPDVVDAALDGTKVVITSKVPGTMEVEVTQTTPANAPRKAPAIHHSTVTVKDTDTGQTVDINVTITEEETLLCPDDNHPHMIDLGLSSGTLWSCCNVGADKPEGYGGYYAWGETAEKGEYSVYTYAHYDWDEDNFSYIGDHIANTQFDVAHSLWQSNWQMPTQEQCEELLECMTEETTINNVNGLLITGPNDNSIFLPFAGFRYETDLPNQGSYGGYWSDTYNDGQFSMAMHLPSSTLDGEGREIGQSVRPVYVEAPSSNLCPDDHHPHMIDLGLPSGTKWACCNVGAEKPENYGNYYAWGETEKKDEYDEWTYEFYGGWEQHYDLPFIDGTDWQDLGKSICGTKYDAAYVNWGYPWQMPSDKQIDEMLENCTFEPFIFNNQAGVKFTGPNDNSIFIPYTGYIAGYGNEGLEEYPESGYFWSGDNYYADESDLDWDEEQNEYFHSWGDFSSFFFIYPEYCGRDCHLPRCFGSTIRPVSR